VTAPSVLVTLENETAGVLARSVADQLAAEGFISIVPDIQTGLGAEAARAYVATLPAANGTTAHLALDFEKGRAVVSLDISGSAGTRVVPLTAATWAQVVGQLSRMTRNSPRVVQPSGTMMVGEHAMHMGHALIPVSAQQVGGTTAPRMIPGLADKQS